MLKQNGEIFLVFTRTHPYYILFDSIYKSKYSKYATRSQKECYPEYHFLDDIKEYFRSLLEETGFLPIVCDFVQTKYTVPTTDMFVGELKLIKYTLK